MHERGRAISMREKPKHERELSMRERAKHEREREPSMRERLSLLSTRERAKHERGRAQHERELSTTYRMCSCGWWHGERWYDPERSPRS